MKTLQEDQNCDRLLKMQDQSLDICQKSAAKMKKFLNEQMPEIGELLHQNKSTKDSPKISQSRRSTSTDRRLRHPTNFSQLDEVRCLDRYEIKLKQQVEKYN